MFDANKYNKYYQKKNRKKILKQRKEYYKNNRKQLLLAKKLYRQKNKDKIKKSVKNYYKKNKEIINFKNKKYYILNKNKIIKQHNLYTKNKKKIDIHFRIKCSFKSRMNQALKGNPKLLTTLKLIGCSIEFLKKYLASKFTKGMSWKNYGKWHIDHIRPCASFDLSKVSEQRECFNYTNLQPLWAEDNLRKSNKII